MRRAAGFTLLEVLIAIVVLGMVIVLVNQGVQFGLQAATLQSRLKERSGDLDVMDRALRRLVAQADPGQFPDPATLRGTADTLALATELPQAGSGPPQPVEATLLAAGGQLHLRWSRLRRGTPFGAAPPIDDTVLADGVTGLRLAYFPQGGAAWQGAWTGDSLPALVRLQLVLAGDRHWPPIIAAPLREPLEQ